MPIPIGTDLSQGVERKKKKKESGFQKVDSSAYQPPVPLERPPMQYPGVGAPPSDYKPPSVDLQLKNLSTAYYKLHDSFPSAFQALVLLRTAPGLPRTVADWEEFLGPGVKDGELPQPGDVETEAMRMDDFDVIGSPYSTQVSGDGVFSPTEADRPAFYSLPESTDPALARQGLDKLLAVREATSDRAETLWEKLQHDKLLADVQPFKEEMAKRAQAAGAKVDFDATTGDVDPATIDMYKRWVAAPQYSQLLYGDADAMERAAEVLQPMIGGEELAWWMNIRDAMKEGGYVSDDVLSTTYDANLFGRPLGQDELNARWDYIGRYGMDKVPQKAYETVIDEQKTIDDAFMFVTKPLMWAMEGTEWLWDKISPIDGIAEQLKGNPEICGKTVAAAASYVHDMGHEFANGELFGKAIGYSEQSAVTLHTMFAMAFGYEIRDGELWGHGDWKPEGEADPAVLWRASEWAKAWRYGEGKMIVNEMSNRIAPMFGVDPDDPVLRSSVVLADYAVAIWAGAKMDAAMWKTAKPMWSATYAGMRKVDAQAHYLKDHFSDARLKVFGSPDAQRGSFVVRGIDSTTPEVGDAMRALLDERDLALAASGGVRAEGVGAHSQVDIIRRVRELGIKREGNDHWSAALRPSENLAAFKGTIRKNGRAMDDVAKTIGQEFPGAGITNADELWEFLQGYSGAKKASAKPAAAASPLDEIGRAHV